MIASDLDTAIAALRDLIEDAERIVPFTGAGISTECGIPDFRSPGGLWSKNQPIQFDDFLASQDMRNEAWRRRFAMEEHFAQAKPGRGHRALASLYRAGRVPGLITQNIDNLHQASGIAADDIVELHGNTTYATCLDCAKRYELSWVKDKFSRGNHCAPDCDCGGYIKTATVSFGQAMPADAMERAEQLTCDCDLFLVDRLLAGGVAGRRLSLAGQTQRGGARHRQSRADRVRRHCRPRRAQRHRRRARALHRQLIRQAATLCTDLCASTFCPLPF